MFKILVIQATNNLSDERVEFLINDRLSFMRFLGLGLEDRVLDARTIWLFREKLTTAGAIKRLFEQFDAMLRQAGHIAMSDQIVDASLVAAPRQRNTDDEKKAIKQGRILEPAPHAVAAGTTPTSASLSHDASPAMTAAQTIGVTGRSGGESRDRLDAGQQAVEVYLRLDQARLRRAFLVPLRTTFFSSALHTFAEPFLRMVPLVKL